MIVFTTKRMPKAIILKGIVKKYPSMVNVGDLRRKTKENQVFAQFFFVQESQKSRYPCGYLLFFVP